MVDVSDLATECEEQLRADALDVQRRVREAATRRPSAPVCEQCEENIPLARQIAVPGVQLCVQCQSAREQLQRRGLT